MSRASAMSARNSRVAHVLRFGFASALAASVTVHAPAQCQYDVLLLEYPINCGISDVRTVGVGWNRHGAVVGYYTCPIWGHTEAFLWTPAEGFVTLPRPAGVDSSIAVDVNDAGMIVGTYSGPAVFFRGFVYEDGEYTELLPLPGGAWSMVGAVNNAGQVTGYRSIGSKSDPVFPYNAFIWTRDDGFIDLGVMDGPVSSGSDISDAGKVVGWTGNGGSISDTFIWQDGSLSFLGPIPGGFTSAPSAVTEDGRIVGSGRIQLKGFPVGAIRAFLWDSGAYTHLGTLPDHELSRAHGISTGTGQIVGRSWYVDGNVNIAHGFIFQNGVITDLTALVLPDLNIEISNARTVADDGTILAIADRAAAILTPVNPPDGDLDLDCHVGIIDFLRLLAHWGSCPEMAGCPADINGDGVVDFLDFAILLGNWG